jgi:LEA14-like dessication related protein
MSKFRFIFFLLGILLFNSCKEFKEVEVTGVKSFRLTKVSADGIEGEVILGIKNPNDYGFSIYPSEFDITYSGMKMGKARLYKLVRIEGHSEKAFVFILYQKAGSGGFFGKNRARRLVFNKLCNFC